jgi:hypothetical protein
MRVSVASIIVLFFTTIAQGGVILDGVPDSQYLQLGSQFPASGLVTSGGSGTLIAPDLVLTAAHVELGNFVVGGNTYTGVSIIKHPQYIANGNNVNAINYGFDIALIRLSSPVTNVTPVPWYRGNAELTATVTMAGFGQTGVGSLGVLSGGGTLRAGTNVIDAIESFSNGPTGQVGAQNAILLADFDSPVGFGNPPGRFNTLGSPTPNALEYHLAIGDSGGGVFIQENGVWYVAGINSGVSNQLAFTGRPGDSPENFGYGAVSFMTRVSSFQDFIQINAVPEPSSVMLTMFAIGMGGTILYRRQISNVVKSAVT